MKSLIFFFLTLLAPFIQVNHNDSDRALKENLKKHISYLASDELEGRFTGTKGAELARKYIIEQYQEIQLITAPGLNTYEQSFDFILKKELGEENYLMFDDTRMLEVNKDYYPLSLSANGQVKGQSVYLEYGIEADDLNYNDYEGKSDLEGKIFIIEMSSPDGIHPHSKYVAYNDLSVRIATAKKHGATAVILVNTRPMAEDPESELNTKTPDVGIPVVFVSNDDLLDQIISKDITLSVDIRSVQATGKNVIGYIDNGKENTVVIGAHFDHLGHGWKGSLHAANDSAIHNGADDNASGVAMMIELARSIKNSDSLKNNNYLFIAFSGEELGLYGSKWFVDHSPIPTDHINYMVNMDMVGRLDSSQILIINGTGTSPLFADLDSLPVDDIKTKCSLSGIGPSDHSSFYLENVPVLHFFTGTHEDYHKPSDDEYKINYEGMVMVYHYILRVMGALDEAGKLKFTETKGQSSEGAPKFSVTLGVIPDYTFSGGGMKIDGVRSGKAAEKAGIKKGDVVIQMGPVHVTDMMAYMKSLSYFKKGDSTDVILLRGQDTIQVKVQF